MPDLKWDYYTFTFYSRNSLDKARLVKGLLYLTLTSWNFLCHPRTVMGLLYLYLNFLEPSGPCEACNGTTIHLS